MAVPIWRVEVVKSRALEQWSNDYLLNDTTIDDAEDTANLILAFEMHIHDDLTHFDYFRVSSYIPDDRVFRHVPINQIGLLTNSESLPLFNTVRMDMATSNSDPARKYYRCPISESNQSNGILQGAYLTILSAAISTYLTTPGVLTHIVTSKGHQVINATIYNQVQMRQLHRRKRKKPPVG